MKTFLSLLQGAALVASVIAQDAYLWTVDAGKIKGPLTQASSISSNTASSILSRRRGLDVYRYLKSADENVLSDVNEFGGFQMPLFGAGGDHIPERVLIRITGFNGAVSEFPSLPDLWIEKPAQDLLDDFKARKNVENFCEYNLQVPGKEGVEIVYSYYSPKDLCLSVNEVRKSPAILTLYSTVPAAKDAGKGMSTLLRMMNHLSATARMESTVLLLPPVSKLIKTPLNRRASTSEEPLDMPNAPTSEQSADVSYANTSKPLAHNVPQCFASMDLCTNTTNTCSGHGSCYKSRSNCFKCKCSDTILQKHEDGGRKTIGWGGNACEKKDISIPFLLFAGFGIFLTSVVVGGIGLLYSMGAEELPSVLGAGVAGPRAQK